MCVLYDPELGINPQDDAFLGHEPWDWEGTPAEKYPLLLNFHPLVIYRHQVLKQADVVLANFLRSDEFAADVQRRNFDYYDAITTGDSSLSACVQAIMAAEVGHADLARALLPTSRCTSTSPTPTATRSTAPTSPTSAGCGPGWCTGSPVCATQVATSASLPACRPAGRRCASGSTAAASDIAIALDPDGATVTRRVGRAGADHGRRDRHERRRRRVALRAVDAGDTER